MKQLFDNRINYTWASLVLSYVLSQLVVSAMLGTGLLTAAPSDTLSLLTASLVVSPTLFVLRQIWYPEARARAIWALRWIDIRVIAIALVLDTLARGCSFALVNSLTEFGQLEPLPTQMLHLSIYVFAAAIIGRYLTQRLTPSECCAPA